jgi:hypothetical protein
MFVCMLDDVSWRVWRVKFRVRLKRGCEDGEGKRKLGNWKPHYRQRRYATTYLREKSGLVVNRDQKHVGDLKPLPTIDA